MGKKMTEPTRHASVSPVKMMCRRIPPKMSCFYRQEHPSQRRQDKRLLGVIRTSGCESVAGTWGTSVPLNSFAPSAGSQTGTTWTPTGRDPSSTLPHCCMRPCDSHLSPFVANCSSTVLSVHVAILLGPVILTVCCKVVAALCGLWSCWAFFWEECS